MKKEKIKSNEGKCRLCGEYGKLTFEHIPPRCAFNDKPSYYQDHVNLTVQESPMYGKKRRSNRGRGKTVLCKKCNNLLGDWYSRDFGDFAHQGMKILSQTKPQRFVSGTYNIKPLNVLKQIVSMFVCIDGTTHVQSQLANFVLDKDSKNLPSSYKIYLYSNFSNKMRMMGYTITWSPEKGTQKLSEINFRPFGYLLAEDSCAAHDDMIDITYFLKYKYDELAEINLKTPFLQVSVPWIGEYN